MRRKSGPPAFGYFFAAFACIFLGVGGWQAWDQGRLLARAIPVAAVLHDARVESHRGSKGGTNYKPVVDFSYVIAGAEYTGHDAQPMVVSTSSSSAAEAAIARVRAAVGPTAAAEPLLVEQPLGNAPSANRTRNAITAWVDPDNHDRAFLLREATFFPYVFILFPMIHVGIGLAIALLATQPPAVIARRLLWLIMLWFGVGLLAAGHFTLIGGEWTLFPQAAILVYGAIGSIPVFVRRKYIAAAEAEAPTEPEQT